MTSRGCRPPTSSCGSAEVFPRRGRRLRLGAVGRAGQAELHINGGGFHGFDLMAESTLEQGSDPFRNAWLDTYSSAVDAPRTPPGGQSTVARERRSLRPAAVNRSRARGKHMQELVDHTNSHTSTPKPARSLKVVACFGRARSVRCRARRAPAGNRAVRRDRGCQRHGRVTRRTVLRFSYVLLKVKQTTTNGIDSTYGRRTARAGRRVLEVIAS
ncbi:hypothetical protein HBB16_01925 [Pseudonocardia sp. MCCB 268]|nr:hypothetical protein [Pseudonocardia cytotoxica]